MNIKKAFEFAFARICSRSHTPAQTTRGIVSKPRRLRLESLENRELLDAASFIDVSSVCEVSSQEVAVSSAIEDRLALDGLGADKLTKKQVFNLSSNPTSSYTIYLDFDGHVCSSGTYWQRFSRYGKITTPAFSLDSNTKSFSSEELSAIYEIWLRVSEDFAPFDVNVTTSEPSLDKLIKSDSNDASYGVRICVGGSYSDWLNVKCGGYAFIGSFSFDSDTPAYVFSENHDTIKGVAEAISHEAGHTLGLNHDGDSKNEYYSGADGWAPIMGFSNYQGLTQWSRGEYSGARNKEDDLAIITTKNGFGYRADDYGDTRANSKTISVAKDGVCVGGVIERNTDVDFFKFRYDGGKLTLQVGGIEGVTNLDALVKLYDSSGKLLQTYDPTDSLSATVEITGRSSGTYYLSVEGTGLKRNGKTIYTDYGSLGQYTIVASSKSESAVLAAPSDVMIGTYNAASQRVSIGWTDNSTFETGFRVEYSSDGGKTWDLSENMKANATSRVATGVKSNALYQFRVRAFCGSNYSDWAYSKILDTGSNEAPTDVTLGAYDPTTRRVALGWTDNSTNETGFRVEYSPDGGETWYFSETMESNATSRVATGLKQNAQYQFRVRANYGSSYSSWAYSELLDTTPVALGAYDAANRRVTLSWTDNSTNETGFRVEYTVDGGRSWNFSEIMEANATSRVATGVKLNSFYQFRVCAIYGSKRSAWSYSAVLDTTEQNVEAPSAVTLGTYDATRRRVTLSWTDNSTNETGFRVEYSVDGGQNWNFSEIMGSNVTSRVATNVKTNSQYIFRVCAFCGETYSDWTYSKTLDTSVAKQGD